MGDIWEPDKMSVPPNSGRLLATVQCYILVIKVHILTLISLYLVAVGELAGKPSSKQEARQTKDSDGDTPEND